MGSAVPRSVVQAFYEAYVSRDPERIAAYLDDDVEWMVAGPVELLRFCGQRRGKAAVIEFFAHLVPSVLKFKSFEPEDLLVDGERAAMFAKLSGLQQSTGRMISYRCAQFLRFRDGKIYSFRSVIDSFDAAEQLLGHPIDLDQKAGRASAVGDLIAV
ncbi:MAG: nuclear transport factor 2 family protein [Hyphomicrobiales bacterium]